MRLSLERPKATANAASSGRWEERSRYQGEELAGLTLGILGYGNIGRHVARMASAFEMKVIVARRNGVPFECGHPTLPLDELLSVADIVSLHLPLTEETRGILGATQIARLKKTACVVNTARGALIDQAAFTAVLQAERLGGFAADVLDPEPPLSNDPFLQCPRALITPHIASMTSATNRVMCISTAENVVAVLQGRAPLPESVFRARGI